MVKNPLALSAAIALRSGAIQGTAITTDDPHVLATDLKDARLEACKSGYAIMSVEACDDASADETYEVTVIGRDDDTGSYVTLATFTIPRGTVGLLRQPMPEFRSQLNYAIDVGGTTPSITFALAVVADELQYGPDIETVITA